jgi:DNA-binding YbaB/EbfC family protein
MGSFDPGQLQNLIGKAQQQYEELQKKMQELVVEGSAGGGAVTVRMNGQKHVLQVTIDPETAKAGDLEMLQDLITAAVNAAGNKIDRAMQSTLGGMLGGMGLGV